MYRLNSKIRSTMLCLSGFEPYSRWVPLMSKRHENERSCSWLIVHCSVTFLVLVTILDFLFARFYKYIHYSLPSFFFTIRYSSVPSCGDRRHNFNQVARMADRSLLVVYLQKNCSTFLDIARLEHFLVIPNEC